MAENDARLAASQMYESVTTLPPAKRHIITHNAEGKSTVHSSPTLQYYGYPGIGGTSRSCTLSSTFYSIPSKGTKRRSSCHQTWHGHTNPTPQLDATSTIPASLQNDQDISAYTSAEGESSYTGRSIVANGSGSHLIVCDLAPGQASMMHRTVSIDYVICTHGDVRMETATGETVDLKPGVRVPFLLLCFPVSDWEYLGS